MKKEIIITEIQKLYPYLEIVDFCENYHIIVKDIYGVYKVQIHSLLSKSKPTINTAIDKTACFKNKLKEINPNIEVVSEYTGMPNRINVKTKYGICSCIASTLLRGQQPCIKTSIDKTQYFINIAKDIHKDKYDYSLSNYINAKSKVKIICKKHGLFEQLPIAHLEGKGCIKCGSIDKEGWWYKNPKNFDKQSNFYILKFEKCNEVFYKFGVSVNVKKRIKTLKRDCKNYYSITLVKQINNSVKYCYILEKKFKNKIKINKRIYTPVNIFPGKHECFI